VSESQPTAKSGTQVVPIQPATQRLDGPVEVTVSLRKHLVLQRWSQKSNVRAIGVVSGEETFVLRRAFGEIKISISALAEETLQSKPLKDGASGETQVCWVIAKVGILNRSALNRAEEIGNDPLTVEKEKRAKIIPLCQLPRVQIVGGTAREPCIEQLLLISLGG